MFEESVDSLRNCLVLPENGPPKQVLAISSAVPGEGKTSLATQLAVSLARATRQPDWVILATDAVLKSIMQANSEPRGRTGPESLNSTGTLQLLPHPAAYNKPVMVLVDEFSASAGDAQFGCVGL